MNPPDRLHSGSVQLYGRSALRHTALRGSHELYHLKRFLIRHGWLLRLKEFNELHHQRPVTIIHIRRYGRLAAGAEYQRAVVAVRPQSAHFANSAAFPSSNNHVGRISVCARYFLAARPQHGV